MNAIVLAETGPPEVLRAERRPDPAPADGEVVVDIRAAAVNRRDLFLRRGIAPSPLPVIPGSDGAGVVRAVGAGVTGVAPGDEVVILPSLAWGGGEDAPEPGFRILGGPDDGTYAEQVAIPAANAFPRPAGWSWEDAAALPLAGLTAWRALVSRARLLPGETVLLIGIGGGVATVALGLARAAGARVLVTSSSDEKIARAVALGAEAGVNYRTTEDWPAAVRDLAGGRGVDVVVDSVGSTWAQSIAAVRPGGRVVVFGGTGGGRVELMVRPVTLGQVALLGTTMGSPREFARLLAAVAVQGWRPAVDSVRPLADAAAAHARMEAGEHFGKLVLVP